MNDKIYKIILAIPIAFSFSIIALFCFLFIGLTKVDAETLAQGTFFTAEVGGSSTFPTSIWAMQANTNWQREFWIYNDEGYTRPYTYILIDFCTLNIDMIKSAYMSNTNYDQNYIKDGAGQAYVTSQTCVMNGLVGNIVRKQYQVGKYQDLDNTGYEKMAGAYLVVKNRYNYAVSFRIEQVYLASDDNLTDVSVQQEETQKVIIGIEEASDKIVEAQDKNVNNIISNNNANTDKITQNQDKNQQQTNEGLQDIEDAITDDTAPNLDAFDNMSGWLPPGPIDSVLNIPLNLLNGLVGVFNNNTCSSISIPIPFIGGNLELPCLYSLYSSINGLSIALTTFFTAISGYLMFKYLSNLYVWIDKTLKMEENSYMQDWGGV